MTTRTSASVGSARMRRVASIPSPPGIRTSIGGPTSGRCSRATATTGPAVAGFADDGDAGGAFQQRAESGADQVLVVDEEDAYVGHAATPASGRCEPRPGSRRQRFRRHRGFRRAGQPAPTCRVAPDPSQPPCCRLIPGRRRRSPPTAGPGSPGSSRWRGWRARGAAHWSVPPDADAEHSAADHRGQGVDRPVETQFDVTGSAPRRTPSMSVRSWVKPGAGSRGPGSRRSAPNVARSSAMALPLTEWIGRQRGLGLLGLGISKCASLATADCRVTTDIVCPSVSCTSRAMRSRSASTCRAASRRRSSAAEGAAPRGLA